MKNRYIIYKKEEARIYHRHYRPSLNVFRFLKTILGIFISGSSPASASVIRRK